jgi:hypothetical protein
VIRMFALVPCLMLALVARVRAEADPAAQLFDDARALMEHGEYAPACPKLEESQRLDPQLGTQLHLGHCYEKLGKPMDAYRVFQAAAELAALRSEPREKLARERMMSLVPELALLEVRPTQAPELTVSLDGAPVARARWNRPFPVEPGDHVLAASAPGREPWEHKFSIAVPARLGINIPALEPRAETTVIADEAQPADVPAIQPAAVSDKASSGPPLQLVAGYVAVGAGVVGLTLGAVFGVLRTAKLSELAGDCDLDRGLCTIEPGDRVARDRIESLREQASTFATGANIAWVVGGLAAAGGITLILTAPRPESPSPALTLGIAPGGLSLTARTHAL